MDESATFSRSVRPSALPRPSRLPLPRATTTRTTSPERSDSRLGQSVSSSTVTSPVKSQTFNGSLRGRPAAASSFLPTPSRPGLQGHSPTKVQTEHRPPLATINRTQAHTGTIRQRDIKPIPAVVVKVERDFLEEQENNVSQNDDSSILEDTVIVSSSDNSSPLQAKVAKRPPRPSLSDRTIQSLAQVPPTPGSNRRRSAFFNPYSPMTTPARPTSAMSTISKLSYGSVRQSAAPKPTPSSLSRNARGPVGYTPRRSISTGVVPGSALSAGTTKRPNPLATSINRPASAAPTLTRSALLRQQATASRIAANTSRPASAMSKSVYGPPAKKIEVRPPSQLSQSVSGARGSSSNLLKTTNTFKPGASATLRSQIANARATVRKQQSVGSGTDTPDFDQYTDPFNQKTAEQDGDPLLERRLDTARRDGRLNIAAMGLKTIPDEVLTMYDEQAMQRSSLAWNETVDLNYLNAADNEIVEIPDVAFPDMSMEELAQSSESTSNQFGGLATLDLHGNMLKHIPMGIRRLERLTTLNLVTTPERCLYTIYDD